FEHPTRWAEGRNASFDVRPPGIRKRLRGWRIGVSLKAEAPDAHTEPAKLYEDVRPLRQRFDRFLPARKDFVALVGIDADRSAAMIEHDLRIRKDIGEIRQFIKLGMIHPGIERVPH